MTRRNPTLAVLALTAGMSCSLPATAQDTFKVAFIDSLSGPFSAIGEAMLNHLQFSFQEINAAGGVLNGVQLELMPYDSKVSAQESQSAMVSAIGDGARVIISGGSGSAVISALVEAAEKNNRRNPKQQVLVMNYSAVDPDAVGKRCSFWYFQIEATTAMKMKAIASYVKDKPDIKKAYLLNQDYVHGYQWASYGKQLIGQARPDVQFVGEEYIPLGRVKDFAPYVSKIKAAGADTIITGNWGPDLSLLYRAAADAGMNVRYFNHTSGAQPGMVTTASVAKAGQLTHVTEWHPGFTGWPQVDAMAKAYQAKTGKEFITPRFDLVPRFIKAGIDKAQSLEPIKIAYAMENIQFDSPLGTLRLRAEDHQLLIPQVVNTIAPVDGEKVKVGVEGTDWGFRTDASFSGEELAVEPQCKMNRP